MPTEIEVRAILIVFQEGDNLVKQHPEIANEYREGATHTELASRYFPNHSKKVGKSIIGHALRKLVDEDERLPITKARRANAGRRVGKEFKVNGKGIFGMSTEDRKSASSKGGIALTILKGRKPWDGPIETTELGKLTEGQYLSKLALMRTCGSEVITKLVNAIFGNDRKQNAVRTRMVRERNKAKKQSQGQQDQSS